MKVIKTIQGLRRELQALWQKGERIGFVPTMGYFHQGHVSLMARSVRENDITVVSLFVNPVQFGPTEDLSRYPRDLRRDCAMAKAAGVAVIFIPSVKEMYPQELSTWVSVNALSEGLCGASRPGHFKGVATVVAKLLNIVQPDTMYLGAKDAQQAMVIKKMVCDLNFPARVVVCPTVRERDGLAMSSRNMYLKPDERIAAKALSGALFAAKKDILSGERNALKIISKIKKLILEETGASIEYVSCVSATDLKPVRRIKADVLIALAVRFPSARLIDNQLVILR
ncbi:MAG: pantoate--beta-alanine ligase [Candidatus Omnitrophica bacterium]|nr:pantoate--beta-alanine ligase [Candidatus Omnitrophota bacterium]